MMYTKTQLQFHETFQPQPEYISAILELACKHFVGTKEAISEQTGIPTGKQKGKVVPHLKYAQYMNLLKYEYADGEYSLCATSLGECIFREDPCLLEGLTRTICSYYLTSKQDGAPQWSYVFNVFPHTFDQPIDYNYLKNRCNAYFGFSVELGVVKNSYQNGMFEGMQLVDWSDKELSYRRGYISKQCMPIYAYTLLDTWERQMPDQREMPLPMVLNELGWGSGFGFDDVDVSMVIDALAEEQYVQVNRQLFPVTVIRFARKEDVIPDIYRNVI